ncbi:hypothetical protein [Ideonella sp.]|uniref:hypothetical protein n=1 Tax=Ideonella sp. TaxID=1929293 RepID=UPI002E323902|nr:hypothetical protein [Ideonella sp.]
MRAAPPVDHPVARLGLWAVAGAGLAALVAATPVWWLGSHAWAMRLGGEAVGWGSLILALFAAVVTFVLRWRQAAARPERRLCWDGAGWQLLTAEGTEELDAPAVRIDLGHAMLLRVRGPGRRFAWLPLERRDAPATWHRLRVALSQPLRSTEPASLPGGVTA